jgi:voltage-gated sodium channel
MAAILLHRSGVPGEESEKTAAEAEAAADDSRQKAAAALQAYEDGRPDGCGVGDAAHACVKSSTFGVFINLCVLSSCVYVALYTYPEVRDDPRLATLDALLATIFLLEVVVKIIAESTRPWLYFYGNPNWKWNLFDFAITVLTIPWLPMPKNLQSVGQTARSLRIIKLLRKPKRVQVIVGALLAGARSIAVIFMLLVLVWFLFGVVGTIGLGTNDPWHFRDFHTSILTLFTLVTLNSWSAVFQISYYGCDQVSFYENDSADPMWHCAAPRAQPLFATVFFVSYALVGSLAMLPMFISTISLSMNRSITELNEETKRLKQEATHQQIARKMHKMAEVQAKSKRNLMMLLAGGSLTGVDIEINPEEGMSVNEVNSSRLLKSVLLTLLEGHDFPFVKKLDRTQFRRLLVSTAETASEWIQGACWFRVLSTSTLVLSGTVLMLSTYPEFQEATKGTALVIQFYIMIAYSFEVGVMLLSFGTEPWRYFKQQGNVFDAVVLLGTLHILPGGSDLYAIMRLLRLFTALTFLNEKIPALRMVVATVDSSAASIGIVGLMLLAVYFQFGMIACVVFSSNDPWHFGNLHLSMLTLFRVSLLDDWITVMYINMLGCDQYGYHNLRASCTSPQAWGAFAALFFMVFVVIATFVVVNLFVGVVSTSMDNEHQKIDAEMENVRKVKQVVCKFCVSATELATYRSAYDLINTDGGPGIEAIEMQEVLAACGVERSMGQVVSSMQEIGGDDLCIDFAEFIEYILSHGHTSHQDKDSPLPLRSPDSMRSSASEPDDDTKSGSAVALSKAAEARAGGHPTETQADPPPAGLAIQSEGWLDVDRCVWRGAGAPQDALGVFHELLCAQSDPESEALLLAGLRERFAPSASAAIRDPGLSHCRPPGITISIVQHDGGDGSELVSVPPRRQPASESPQRRPGTPRFAKFEPLAAGCGPRRCSSPRRQQRRSPRGRGRAAPSRRPPRDTGHLASGSNIPRRPRALLVDTPAQDLSPDCHFWV